MARLAYVGERVVRKDASEKVTGRAVYGVDVKLPGMLQGRILRSPVPHARIATLDTSRAERLTGVRAVVTGRDAPFTHNASIIKDWPFFAQDKVRHVGEAVAAVAAVDEETAEEALSLIDVEYEELPAVFGAEAAMRPSAPLVHEKMMEYPRAEAFHPVAGTNICNYFKLRRGDADAALAGADLVVEERYTTAMMQHCPMETHVAVALQTADGRLTVWTGAQSPYWTRFELATALGIPMNDLRIIVPYVGGGFGAKHAVKVEQYAIALARKTRHRPVRVVLSRAEEFGASLARQPTIIDVKTGVTREGRITARHVKILWNTGAYADLSPAVSRNAGFAAAGPYVIPNVWVDSYCVYTNNPVCGAFRGFGVPEVTWAGESQLDTVARRLGMDPLELRLRNAVEEGSESVLGEVLHSVGVKECLQKAAAAVGWTGPKGARRGRGVACMHKSTGTPTSSAAFVKLNEDGTVSLLSSAVEMGQGSETVLAQMVAEELGVKMEHIRVATPDTDVTPYERSTTSSRTTFHSGNALVAAARDAKEQILEIAAQALEASPQDLELRDEKVSVRGAPDRSVTLAGLWKAGMYSRGQYPILGRGAYSTSGIYDPLDPETGRSKRSTAFWMYAAQAAEIEVDLDTGKVTVLKLGAAHDMGRAINPQTCEQQIEGALVMGLGQALFEELVVDHGRPVNPSFIDYKLPCTLDIPELEAILVEAAHDEGPFGAKGLGEPGLAPTAAAIGNAILDAIGVRMCDLPITAEKVLAALRARAGRKA